MSAIATLKGRAVAPRAAWLGAEPHGRAAATTGDEAGTIRWFVAFSFACIWKEL